MREHPDELPSQHRHTWIIIACVCGSLLLHGVAYGVLYEIPKPRVTPRTTEDIIRRRPPRPRPRKYKVKLEKRPRPRLRERPRPRPREVKKVQPRRPRVVRRYRPMAPPPRAAERPRPRPRPVLDLTMGAGVNDNLTSANGAFTVNTGDSAQGDPTVAPRRVRPRRRPRRAAAPPPPRRRRARPVPVYVKVLPKPVQVPRPRYPPAAKRMQIEGTVRLSVTVGRRGQVLGVRVLKRLGYGLDEAAVRAMKRARFKPAMGSNGKPMAYTIRYRFRFRLQR